RDEQLVELKLSGSTLGEILAFLKEVERASNPAYIKRLELKRHYDDHSRFEAVIVVAAALPS
ncbi:MAG: hypothetical protein D6815_04320, partial [Candidatus Dadabacteria bacterium]